ncbi:hypothetical protein CISG_06248 [Coccidioides immitis RMSCC 3703]|uniref:Uncharacterized protein n=2 Tax=Coccidioides immitis TaxID=5501 RepID=A0A0J8R031_COCIT|nr:hypothetical protein CIRG_06437 [Coccidioides immitis RMSCC 2394]KMU77013.1 hypothetical protein CISG_06248 [Coccidioides immitis RMSCC 3703]
MARAENRAREAKRADDLTCFVPDVPLKVVIGRKGAWTVALCDYTQKGKAGMELFGITDTTLVEAELAGDQRRCSHAAGDALASLRSLSVPERTHFLRMTSFLLAAAFKLSAPHPEILGLGMSTPLTCLNPSL